MARTTKERSDGKVISNDGLLAVLESRLESLEEKFDKMDSRMWLVAVGVAGGLLAQLARFLFPHA